MGDNKPDLALAQYIRKPAFLFGTHKIKCLPFSMKRLFIKMAKGAQGLLEEILRVFFNLFHVEEIIAKLLFIDEIRGFMIKRRQLLNMPDIALNGALRAAGKGEILNKTFS